MVKPIKFSVLFTALAILPSCAPLRLYYKPGVEVSRMQSDSLKCETRAVKDAPVANEIRQRPPMFYPGGNYCNASGCYSRPGYWVEGNIYTVDVNLGLRQRIEQSCMADIGYQLIELQNCKTSIAKAAGTTPTTRLPRLSQNSCAIRNKDGSFQIVEPG